MSEQKLEAYFFTSVFIAVLVLVGVLFYPFIGALALALVLAILAMPLYDWLSNKTHKPNISAFVVVVIVTVAVVLPAIGLMVLLVDEAVSVVQYASTADLSSLPTFFDRINDRIHEVLPSATGVNMSALFQDVTNNIGKAVAGVVTGTLDAVFKLLITLIALYFFLRDGHVFVRNLVHLSPLADDEDNRIVQRIRRVTRSLIRGTLVIALLQGVLTGLGFMIFGVPNPVLWGSVAAVGALVPTIGTGVVAAPALLYLVLTGNIPGAIGFAAWAVVIVGLVDNILAPKLIGGGARIHPLFILLSVLGGLALFDLAGFLLGPLIFGLLVALFEIYKAKIQELHNAGVT